MTNKTNELSHLSSKSNKLHPPQDWGSCTGWEYRLQETLATPGPMPPKVAPHTGWLHPALLPREPLYQRQPHHTAKCSQTVDWSPGHQFRHPRPELTGRQLPLQPRPLLCGPAIPTESWLALPVTSRTRLGRKPCPPLSMLTGHEDGLMAPWDGAEAGAVHGRHRRGKGTSGVEWSKPEVPETCSLLCRVDDVLSVPGLCSWRAVCQLIQVPGQRNHEAQKVQLWTGQVSADVCFRVDLQRLAW